MKDVTIETNKGKENRYIISSFFHGMVVVCKGSRTVLDSGLYAMIPDLGFRIPSPGSLFLAVELRIPIVNGISDSSNCIPNSEA